MINLLQGPPGGGKSYEAVVYHIIPALQQGRMVITNLALNFEYIELIMPESKGLVEIRRKTLAERKEVDWKKSEDLYRRFGIAQKSESFSILPFTHLEDYGHPWRHPISGAGPLYVIDECHLSIPVRGTPIPVEEWFSLHRHESADCLLISQSFSKVNRAVREMAQLVYRVRKNTAFGSQKSYTRKVQDGLKGEVVNQAVRVYEKKYFPFYQSHTKGGGAELAARDIKPIWQHWSFVGSAVLISFALIAVVTGNVSNPMKPQIKSESVAQVKKTEVVQQSTKPAIQPITNVKALNPNPVNNEPFSGFGVHIAGYVAGKNKIIYLFMLSRNGQGFRNINSSKIEAVGYKIRIINECAAYLEFGTVKRFITCDSPQQSVMPGQNFSLPEQKKSVEPPLSVN